MRNVHKSRANFIDNNQLDSSVIYKVLDICESGAMESSKTIKIHELGHIVLYVTNLTTMVGFYEGILGFHLIQKRPGIAVFGAGRTHHELLLIEVGGSPNPPGSVRPGLYHIGFKIGNTDEKLKIAIASLQSAGVSILGASDHTVTHSLYIADPDGNELELYVDISDEWRHNPEAILTPVRPLEL